MRLLDLLRHAVFPINALPAFSLAGAGIAAASRDAGLKRAAAAQYYREVDADLLFCPSDIAIQAEALGAPVRLAAGSLPAVSGPAPRPPGRVRVSDRMRVNAAVVRGLAQDFPHRPVAALVYGPFTVAGQVMGEETLLHALGENPARLAGLLGLCARQAIRYGELQAEAGASVLWISDPLAGLAPPELYPAFCGRGVGQVLAAFPAMPSALHICGDVRQLLPAMLATGVQGISFDNCLDLPALEDEVPAEVAIIGNLDPAEGVELASREEVEAGAADLAACMAHRENFILSTGCALPVATPIANAAAFVRAGRAALSGLAPALPRLRAVAAAVGAGDGKAAARETRRGLDQGIAAQDLLAYGLARAIRLQSSRFEAKKLHLPQVLRTVDAFRAGLAVLDPFLEKSGGRRPDVILGTVRGDLHEMGKNLVRLFLETGGLAVLDLGVDVTAGDFAAAWQEHRAPVVGLSVFVASARPQVRAVAEALAAAGGGEARIVVGGAAMSPETARAGGAHGYARDGVRAVRLVRDLLRGARA